MTTLILGTGLPAPRDVVDVVYARTDGVPLHIEELCSALGRDRLADSAAVLEAAVPETLEDATLARMARLSPDAQAVARAGAVIGRSFVPTVLAGVMNLPVEELDDPIQELLDHDVLDAAPRAASQFDFRHQLLRDALYRSVPAGDRRRFHARAAEFGGLLEGSSTTHASMHFERAGMTDGSVPDRARGRGARDAARVAQGGIQLLRRAVDNMPASLADSERARILLLFADANGNIDANAIAADLSIRAGELALRAGNLVRDRGIVQRRRLRLDAKASASRAGATGARLPQRDRGHFAGPEARHTADPRAVASGDGRVRRLPVRGSASAASGSTRGRCRARRRDPRWIDNSLAQLDVIDGRVAEGIATIRSIGEAVRRDGEEDTGVGCYRDVALLAIRAMDFREASVGLDEGPPLRGVRRTDVVRPHPPVGRGPRSRGRMAAGMTLCGRVGRRSAIQARRGSRMLARWALGYVEAGRGRRREAEEHLPARAGLRPRARRGSTWARRRQWGLAEAALHAGDAGRCGGACDEALRLAREAGEWISSRRSP